MVAEESYDGRIGVDRWKAVQAGGETVEEVTVLLSAREFCMVVGNCRDVVIAVS